MQQLYSRVYFTAALQITGKCVNVPFWEAMCIVFSQSKFRGKHMPLFVHCILNPYIMEPTVYDVIRNTELCHVANNSHLDAH